ncbi:MAG: uracil-DNA glycosylase [Clostridiales bacterium]|nr:uracil-DNA glycosylase [Clostridiales bacterium]
MVSLNNDWDEILKGEFEKTYYLNLRKFLKSEYTGNIVYPPMNDIFNALKYTPYKDVKVVILGQDPYIKPGEAHGLAFSVQPSAKIPPSLRNIFIEMHEDVGTYIPNNGYLASWTRQGVMLLNTCLTVRAGKSKSHAQRGWEIFTGNVIKTLNGKTDPVVFLLWGKDAAAKNEFIVSPIHLVLTAAHPSPLAGGRFFGCKHFSKTNEFLKQNYGIEINWQIENL